MWFSFAQIDIVLLNQLPLNHTPEFDRFAALLSEMYPAAMEKLHFERAGKAGLSYRWEGATRADPVVLMAHYDVVPAKAEEWSFDPFSGEVRDGVVLGRGALDTKSTLCAIFEAVDKLCRENYQPQRDFYLCVSGTEEIAGEGAYAIVDKLQKDGVKPCLTQGNIGQKHRDSSLRIKF